MDQLLYVLTLLVALCTCSGGVEKCPEPGATSFTFSVASRRNLTGNWIVSVAAAREDGKEAPPPRDMAVEVGQTTSSCQDTDTTLLKAVAVLSVSDVTPVATVAPATPRTPPAGYEMVNSLGYYKMHAIAVTWTEARDKCVQEGAHLIILNSDKEAEVVRTFYDRKPRIPNDAHPNNCFAGFHDRDKEGEYVTVLGEPLSSTGFTRWGPGEPNGGASENCGTILQAPLALNDAGCNLKLFFICEYSS